MAVVTRVGAGGGTAAPSTTHKVATPNPNPTPVTARPQPDAGPLSWWWALLTGGPGSSSGGTPTATAPISKAVLATDYLPLCYGQVRISVAPIWWGPTGYGGAAPWKWGQAVIAWCEGPIQSIDAVLANGSPIRTTFTDWYQKFTRWDFTGIAGELNSLGGAAAVLGKLAVSNRVAATFMEDLDLMDYVYGPGMAGWWGVMGGTEDGTGTEYAADVHGCLLYDPRKDSTSVGYDATLGVSTHRETDETTWTYSSNPILEWRDVRRRAAKQDSSTIDDVSVGTSATASDTAGFSCNIAFATLGTLDDAIATILQTCNGVEIRANGKVGVFVDIVNAGAPVASFSEADGGVFDLTYQWLSVRDRYTQIAVSFNNKDAGYVTDQTPFFGDPGTFSSEPTVLISSVTTGTGTLHLASSPGWTVGDTVLFFQDGGATVGGMNDGQTYYVKSISGADVTLSAVSGGALNAITGTPVLTAQYLQRVGASYPPTIAVKSTVVTAPGINTMAAAVILRDYAYNEQAISFRMSGSINGLGVLLQQGQKITITTLKLPAADYLLAQIAGDANGFFQFVAKPYSASVYGSTPISVAPPVTPPTPPDTTAPPPPAAPRVIGASSVAMDPPRVYTVGGPYGAGLWTVTGATSYTASKINDSDATVAAVVVASGANAYVQLDLGLGNTAAFGRFDFWTNYQCSSTIPFATSPLAALEYSDDGTTWVDALTSSVGAGKTCAWQDAAAGGIYPQHIEIPSSIGTHRWWRLTFSMGGGGSVYEIQASTFATWSGSTPTGYELRTWPGGGPTPDFSAPSLAQPMIVTSATLPTDASPLAIFATLLVSQTGDSIGGTHIVESGAVDTLSATARSSTQPIPFYARQDAIPTFKPPPVFGSSGGGVIMEVPAGVVDGTNTVFTLTYLPSQPRILLIVDGQPLIGGVDYTRTLKVATIKAAGNPPRVSVYAVYTTTDAIIYPFPGSPEASVPGTAITWATHTAAARHVWRGVTWADALSLLVAVASDYPGFIMTSGDGTTWASQSGGLSGLCGVATSGTGLVAISENPSSNLCITSPDGITWTNRTCAHYGYSSVCYAASLGRFVAVRSSAGGADGWNAQFSTDNGHSWSGAATPGTAMYWSSVCWSPTLSLLVAVASSGSTAGLRVMTSSDGGATWTAQTTPKDNAWNGVVWSAQAGLFVAVASASATGSATDRVMTSPDGVTWTLRTTPAGSTSRDWRSVCWSDLKGLFVAVASPINGGADQVMTSTDGITWTLQTSPADSRFYSVCTAEPLGLFVAVAGDDTTNDQVMTSAT